MSTVLVLRKWGEALDIALRSEIPKSSSVPRKLHLLLHSMSIFTPYAMLLEFDAKKIFSVVDKEHDVAATFIVTSEAVAGSVVEDAVFRLMKARDDSFDLVSFNNDSLVCNVNGPLEQHELFKLVMQEKELERAGKRNGFFMFDDELFGSGYFTHAHVLRKFANDISAEVDNPMRVPMLVVVGAVNLSLKDVCFAVETRLNPVDFVNRFKKFFGEIELTIGCTAIDMSLKDLRREVVKRLGSDKVVENNILFLAPLREVVDVVSMFKAAPTMEADSVEIVMPVVRFAKLFGFMYAGSTQMGWDVMRDLLGARSDSSTLFSDLMWVASGRKGAFFFVLFALSQYADIVAVKDTIKKTLVDHPSLHVVLHDIGVSDDEICSFGSFMEMQCSTIYRTITQIRDETSSLFRMHSSNSPDNVAVALEHIRFDSRVVDLFASGSIGGKCMKSIPDMTNPVALALEDVNNRAFFLTQSIEKRDQEIGRLRNRVASLDNELFNARIRQYSTTTEVDGLKREYAALLEKLKTLSTIPANVF